MCIEKIIIAMGFVGCNASISASIQMIMEGLNV
jgi:hypothetical protein